jgi:hypothetical protein
MVTSWTAALKVTVWLWEVMYGPVGVACCATSNGAAKAASIAAPKGMYTLHLIWA